MPYMNHEGVRAITDLRCYAEHKPIRLAETFRQKGRRGDLDGWDHLRGIYYEIDPVSNVMIHFSVDEDLSCWYRNASVVAYDDLGRVIRVEDPEIYTPIVGLLGFGDVKIFPSHLKRPMWHFVESLVWPPFGPWVFRGKS